MKICTNCKRPQDEGNFRRKKGGILLQSWCRSCGDAAATARNRLRRTGCSVELFENLKARNPVCPLCLKRPSTHADHDHVRNQVRGVICHNCNVALGLINDDPEVLKRMVIYLWDSRKIVA